MISRLLTTHRACNAPTVAMFSNSSLNSLNSSMANSLNCSMANSLNSSMASSLNSSMASSINSPTASINLMASLSMPMATRCLL